MIQKYSLTKALLGSQFLEDGVIAASDHSILKAYRLEPFSSQKLEEGFEGPDSEKFFSKISELLSKLPSHFEGQILLSRKQDRSSEVPSYKSSIFVFEQVKKQESYSHLEAVFKELGEVPKPLLNTDWDNILQGFIGKRTPSNILPDLVWEKDSVSSQEVTIRALSLTELPQLTWKGCLQSLFELPEEFMISFKLKIPDRLKVKRQLETKRKVSHALSVTNSLEVKNIESNSVLSSSEETLERILLSKETLFEISLGVILTGDADKTLKVANEMERLVSGLGNAGLYLEGIGTQPVLKSHIPGNKTLGIRKLPILSGDLCHLLPLLLDYSRDNDSSHLQLRSRCNEVSHLNLFSSQNLNFNAFICGASGAGKSFFMNAILASSLVDEPKTRICIFDIGGSYKNIVNNNGGKTLSLLPDEARALIVSFLKNYPVDSSGFYKTFIQTLCGSGSHITHSHSVAIEDILRELSGKPLKISQFINLAQKRKEKFYQDLAHWLKPHGLFDEVASQPKLTEVIKSQVTAFDFKELGSDPVLQRTTILILSELLWRDLVEGKYPRTQIIFDEVWRFFSESKGFLEEMYRTLRKYKAGIVSITQNLADYGDEAFAKMVFTNSYTKLFLQNGASAEYLNNTFDLPDSDITRALSVVSKKPHYSEVFALSPQLSQVFRLYPTKEFYALANTENIAKAKEVSA